MNCDLHLITLLSGEKEPPVRIPGDVAFKRQKLSCHTFTQLGHFNNEIKEGFLLGGRYIV